MKLGQNFLADRNVLGVIERLAALRPDEVVLEVGGGEGVLSERLAAGVRFLHVVEIDRGLEGALRERLNPFGNVALHMQDALDLDLPALDPPPQAMVANLPYGIAATLILRTIEELPSLQRWLVMVQREVGERLAARPGGRTYGAPSVLAALSCDVRVVRAIPRTVFRPVPHVDSVLVALERTGPPAEAAVRALVHQAFAHRRKTLAGSLALAAGAPADIRMRARAALEAMGHPPNERAERLAPGEFLELSWRLR
ncbi:MAG TPA: 16S rRNA (adenine(1518)-N(6)/adenine(1519)-N(6))-dimethyltransferase RsmA [Solirubrobacteraceae bacterium]|nr:16S rRNA (adenine(1518)-N(6)/adenine(1519)-N(6))-dimethyltransferase RsmA [Solirubrobacteraceae bacterium]